MSNAPSTEDIPAPSDWLDALDDEAALEVMLAGQNDALKAVAAVCAPLAAAADAITNRLKQSDHGRLIYAGAGTSARIGVQDGVELTPTFGWPSERLGYLIAGGKAALMVSVEGAEDDTDAAIAQVKELDIGAADIVLGLAASGSTPYTIAAVTAACEAGALTIGVANNAKTPLLAAAHYPVLLATGGEAIAGSTRLKAATAQKICLNMMSTLVMVRLGRARQGMMTSMHPTNAKLRRRKALMDTAGSLATAPEQKS